MFSTLIVCNPTSQSFSFFLNSFILYPSIFFLLLPRTLNVFPFFLSPMQTFFLYLFYFQFKLFVNLCPCISLSLSLSWMISHYSKHFGPSIDRSIDSTFNRSPWCHSCSKITIFEFTVQSIVRILQQQTTTVSTAAVVAVVDVIKLLLKEI